MVAPSRSTVLGLALLWQLAAVPSARATPAHDAELRPRPRVAHARAHVRTAKGGASTPRVGKKRSAEQFEGIAAHVEEAAGVYGVPLALVLAVIRVESAFQVRAKSRVGATGMMQLMLPTATTMGVLDRLDARQNILGGTRYLRLMLDRWQWDYRLAIASYNAGPGAVARYRGVPPYAETTRYVKRVLRYLQVYQRLLAAR